MSLQSKGLSRVFSNATVQKRQFFALELREAILSAQGPKAERWKNEQKRVNQPDMGKVYQRLIFVLKNIFFFNLAVPGLSCGTQVLWSSLRHVPLLLLLQHLNSYLWHMGSINRSLTSDRTLALCIRSMESKPPEKSLMLMLFYVILQHPKRMNWSLSQAQILAKALGSISLDDLKERKWKWSSSVVFDSLWPHGL